MHQAAKDPTTLLTASLLESNENSVHLKLQVSRKHMSHLFVFCRPDLIDMELVSRQSNRENLEQAFEIAESLGVTRLLDAEGETIHVNDRLGS